MAGEGEKGREWGEVSTDLAPRGVHLISQLIIETKTKILYIIETKRS